VSELNQAAQIEALKDLISSQGWKLYRDMVVGEISGDFEEHITKALDVPDAAVALDRMRQVAAVRKAGLRWLRLPQERLEALAQSVNHRHDIEDTRIGRRPVGL
jgi:hypothetical protein